MSAQLEFTPFRCGSKMKSCWSRNSRIHRTRKAGVGGRRGASAGRLTRGLGIDNEGVAEPLEIARRNMAELVPRVRYHHGPFSGLRSALSEAGVEKVDGLLADLGVSRYQLTEPERGFSLMADGPLDMRMDRAQPATAADIVNYSAEKALADLIYQLGEERRSRRIARAIVRARPVPT